MYLHGEPVRTTHRSPFKISRRSCSRWGASSRTSARYGATKYHSSSKTSLEYGSGAAVGGRQDGGRGRTSGRPPRRSDRPGWVANTTSTPSPGRYEGLWGRLMAHPDASDVLPPYGPATPRGVSSIGPGQRAGPQEAAKVPFVKRTAPRLWALSRGRAGRPRGT